MILVLFILFCTAAAIGLFCIFRYEEGGTAETRRIRNLIGQLWGMGYLPVQISEILDLYS